MAIHQTPPKEVESIMLFVCRCRTTGEPTGLLGSISYSDYSKEMISLSLEVGCKLLNEMAEQIKDIQPVVIGNHTG